LVQAPGSAIGTPGPAALQARCLGCREKLQDDVDFRLPRSSLRYQADMAESSKETANLLVAACNDRHPRSR
jgi:hypothetical protein